MTEVRKNVSRMSQDNARKWENIRRLRYGALIRLFRARYGNELPNDEAGVEDLWLLLQNVSLALSGAEKKMRCAIEIWAPWLPEDEAEARVELLKKLTIYERTPTARELGDRLNVTSTVRERLKLWPFLPVDMTDEQLAEQRKAKDRQRKAARRRQLGVKPRSASLLKLKPWEAEGISRPTWYRRREKVMSATIVSELRTELSQPLSVESQRKSLRQKCEREIPRKVWSQSGGEE